MYGTIGEVIDYYWQILKSLTVIDRYAVVGYILFDG